MRIKMSVKPLVTAAVAIGVLAASSSAMAAAPTGVYAPFKYCPYTNTAVQSCLVSTSTGGAFQLGNANVPVTSSTPVVLQGGFSLNDDLTTTWFNAVGADTLVKTPLKVPGGLLGLVSTGGWSGFLIDAFNNAVAAANDVYATAELVGPVKFDYFNYLIEEGSTVQLPVRIHLENPFLGPSCYIGSSSSPVTFKLTTGLTTPPAGTTPIRGSSGLTSSTPDGTVVTATGVKLVDNAFSVPAASNCGYLPLDKILITAAVNLKEGLPSAAGRNSATLTGGFKQGDRAATQASVH
ncbi:hypothetical protein DSM104299_05519 [Baekduia alba]|uniref:hypothetical protein n=1 Tax=Baekduia alba TaxID=2997333 RepID=UPI0023400DF4|nr:hypothetical protein [Baekduia alba]WCB96751.1 hypothetical protein DSM104299_05519 [Baekduia alba]